MKIIKIQKTLLCVIDFFDILWKVRTFYIMRGVIFLRFFVVRFYFCLSLSKVMQGASFSVTLISVIQYEPIRCDCFIE